MTENHEVEVARPPVKIELPGGRHISVDRRRSVNLQWIAILLTVLFQLYHSGQENLVLRQKVDSDNVVLRQKLDSVERRIEQVEGKLFMIASRGQSVDKDVGDHKQSK